MACVHKFEEYLNLQRLDFEPVTLIVGTFNPSWPVSNGAEWFYGRTENNNFWDVLPRLYQEQSLITESHLEWKQFCQNKQIAITDLISSIADADQTNATHVELMGGYADDDIVRNFFDFDLVNIIRVLRNHPTICNVYVTRSFTDTFWKNKIYPIKKYCESTGIGLKSIITPSGYAYLQQGKYNNLNPNAQLSLRDFILMRWREVWNQI